MHFEAEIRAAQTKLKGLLDTKKSANAFLEKVNAETKAYLAEEKAAAEKKAAADAVQWVKDYDAAVAKAAPLKKALDDA
jgi:hypothetical protein